MVNRKYKLVWFGEKKVALDRLPLSIIKIFGGMKDWWRLWVPDLSGGYRSDSGDGIRNKALLMRESLEEWGIKYLVRF